MVFQYFSKSLLRRLVRSKITTKMIPKCSQEASKSLKFSGLEPFSQICPQIVRNPDFPAFFCPKTSTTPNVQCSHEYFDEILTNRNFPSFFRPKTASKGGFGGFWHLRNRYSSTKIMPRRPMCTSAACGSSQNLHNIQYPPQPKRTRRVPPPRVQQPGPEVPELPDVPGPHRWPLFGAPRCKAKQRVATSTWSSRYY